MIAKEIKSGVLTIRIHDDFCEQGTEQCLSNLTHIISTSYMRRSVSEKMKVPPSENDAMVRMPHG